MVDTPIVVGLLVVSVEYVGRFVDALVLSACEVDKANVLV